MLCSDPIELHAAVLHSYEYHRHDYISVASYLYYFHVLCRTDHARIFNIILLLRGRGVVSAVQDHYVKIAIEENFLRTYYSSVAACMVKMCDCLSENPPSLHLPVFREIPF